MNPLFAHDDDEPETPAKDAGYVIGRGKKAHVDPPKHNEAKEDSEPRAEHGSKPKEKASSEQAGADQAAELIRNKIDRLYAAEPDAKEEADEAKETVTPRSKHQQFMHDLSTSGKSLAQIQTAWHEYYVALPDDEKHEVWHEFYAANARQPSAYSKFVREHTQGSPAATAMESNDPKPSAPKLLLPTGISPSAPHGENAVVSDEITHEPRQTGKPKTVAQLRKQVLKKVQISNEAQRKAKQHVQSLLFGVGMGALTLIIVLFSFFNEVIIAPFIQPSRHVTNTPIILSSSDITASSTPEVIIPKINVEIPVNYSLTTDDENTVENALEGGVVHYASTVFPGQDGNAAFFGHSSNNIFNPGQYKFAFVLLHTLVPGDIFYLTYNGVVYTYKVYDKQIVSPSDVAVLNDVPNHTATAALITCDPPGTSNNRLVVWGDQISPNPTTNATAAPTATTQAKALASNGPSLWDRFIHLF
ncbi:MAG TPA: class E sortase [Candidatus Saccharimonadales bacterium]